jgi:hypothetical protein
VAVRFPPASLGLLLREMLMLVLSQCARETSALSVSSSPFTQMIDRRLSIAQKGLVEARQYLAAGQVEDADIVLEKIDEDLHLLRCRIRREMETIAPRPAPLHESAN